MATKKRVTEKMDRTMDRRMGVREKTTADARRDRAVGIKETPKRRKGK
jgi:hypothetical protein